MKILVPQKSVPKPMNISLDKNPINILSNESKKRGVVIRQPPSCALIVCIFEEFGFDKNTKYNNLVE